MSEDLRSVALAHAELFLAVLREAQQAFTLGGENTRIGLDLFDEAWPNISLAQERSAQLAPEDSMAASLTIQFSLSAGDLLTLRIRPRDRINWHSTALAATRQLKDAYAEVRVLGNLAMAHMSAGEVARAAEIQEQGVHLADAASDLQGEGRARVNLGLIRQVLGNVRAAMIEYQVGKELLTKSGDRQGVGAALGSLGEAYRHMGDTTNALDIQQRRLTIARELNDKRAEATALSNIGLSRMDVGELGAAAEAYFQALAVGRELRDGQLEANSLGNLGTISRRIGDYETAVGLYQ